MYVIITKPNNILIWLTHVFPHLAQVTYFPMLGISYINLLWVQIVTIHVLFISTLIAPSLELNKSYNFQDCITKTFVQEKKWLSPMHFCHLHPPLPSKMFLYYDVPLSLLGIDFFIHTSISYIVINVILHATKPQYRRDHIHVTTPFQQNGKYLKRSQFYIDFRNYSSLAFYMLVVSCNIS